MAIDTKEFIHQVDTNLKSNKSYDKFFINFTKDGKRIRKIIDFSNKSWDKRTRISKAKVELDILKGKIENSTGNFNENSTLNDIADIFYSTNPKYDSDWGRDLKRRYELHCEHSIGKKKIKDIAKVHIDRLIQQMLKVGHGKKAENGCSIATIKKVLNQSLKPVIQYAIDNNVIHKMPSFDIPKQKVRTKRTVTHGQEKLALLFKTINELYQDDPFYRALFLLALYGRRWNEIRTLKWSDIDWSNNTYTIQAENNKIGEDQTYTIPEPMRNTLLEIKDDHIGLVFKSPKTAKELHPPKKQLAKIKELSGIEELTMHYFRHIFVSAIGELGMAGTVLSASLGHTNLNTVNDYYLSVNHTKASHEANLAIESITSKA